MAENDRTLGLNIDVEAETAGASEAKAALDQVKESAKGAAAAVDDVDARAKAMAAETAEAAKAMAAEQRNVADAVKETGAAAKDTAGHLDKINQRDQVRDMAAVAQNLQEAGQGIRRMGEQIAQMNPELGESVKQVGGLASAAGDYVSAATQGFASGGAVGAGIGVSIQLVKSLAGAYMEAAQAAHQAAEAEKQWNEHIRTRIDLTSKALEQTVASVEKEREMQAARESSAKLEERIREKMNSGASGEAGALAADKQARLKDDGQGMLSEGSRKVMAAQMEQLKALAISPEFQNDQGIKAEAASIRAKLQADEDAQRRTGLKNLEELNKALETFADLAGDAAKAQEDLGKKTAEASVEEARLAQLRADQKAAEAEATRQQFIDNWRGQGGAAAGTPGAPADQPGGGPGGPPPGGGGGPVGGGTMVPSVPGRLQPVVRPENLPVVSPENMPDTRSPVQKLLGDGMARTRAAIAGGGGGGEEATVADAQEARAKQEEKSNTLKDIKKELDGAKGMEKEADGLVGQVAGLVQSFGSTMQGFKSLIDGLKSQLAHLDSKTTIMDKRLGIVEMRTIGDADKDGKLDYLDSELNDLKQTVARVSNNTSS